MKCLKILAIVCACLCCQYGNAQQAVWPALEVDSGEVAQMLQTLRVADAQALLKKQIAAARRKRQSVETLEQWQERADEVLRGMKSAARVLVLDSVIVPKQRLLDAYGLTGETGKVWMEQGGRASAYETGRGDRRIVANAAADGGLALTQWNRVGDSWERDASTEGLPCEGDANYPFLLSDGITLYFAARGEDGLGNYDLYVTRYDSESNRFYKAENMGMPFNSYANDYMLVIDESQDIGWFASDRFQEHDRVCIYTFVPPTSRRTIDFENTPQDSLRAMALLRPLSSTWNEGNLNQRIAAKQRLAQMEANAPAKQGEAQFRLVINDLYTYTSLDQFKSAEARRLCTEWMQKKSNLDELTTQLDTLRRQYAESTRTGQKALTQQILDLEQRVGELAAEVHEAEKLTRNTELNQ